MNTLASRQRDAIFAIDWARAGLRRGGRQAVLALPDCTVVPQQLLLTAGAGNEHLVAGLASTGRRCSAARCSRCWCGTTTRSLLRPLHGATPRPA